MALDKIRIIKKIRGRIYEYEKERLWQIWENMKARCKYPSYRQFKDYGGKGISIYGPWLDYESFKEWAIGSGYKKGLSLDRIDNEENYCPENCRWVDKAEQRRNRKCVNKFNFKGKSLTLGQISKIIGVPRSTLAQRYYVYKWPLNKLFKEGIK